MLNKKFFIQPTEHNYVLLYGFRENQLIFLYGIDCFFFVLITEKRPVYSAVQTRSLNTIKFSFSL
jgi:hypothetical protein